MRKKSKQFFSLLVITLLLGGVLSSSALAKGDRPEKLDSRGTFQTEAGIQSTTEMTLQESTDQIAWTDVYGNAATGYTMILDPANEYEYLDVSSITPPPASGDYPFVLDPVRVPAGFWDYWAGKGVTASATEPWQMVMWDIINGDLPMFYLRVNGTSYDLIDGLMFAMAADPALVTDKLKVNGDYPLHTYNFQGTIGTETFVIGITFTRAVTTSLWKDGVELVPYIDVNQPGTPIVIDGCGYVDVTIRLENVYNLYAVDLSLTFDPDFVEVVDRLTNETDNPGINLLPIAPWDNPLTAYTVKNIAYNEDDPSTTPVEEAGTIRFIASLLNTQAPITGGLDVATIRLRAKDLGESMLSITGMELSDRDGYLVGVPLVEQVDYTVTTQFTEAGGLDLGIIRSDPATVRLSWSAQATDEVEIFTLHRSTLPYFIPDPTPSTGTIYRTLTNDGSTHTFDDVVLGNVLDNYFYTMQITCSSGLVSPYAWQVGKFEYELYETTDLTWYALVGLVLENSSFVDTSTLATHIEANSVPPVDVISIATWDAPSQSFQTPLFSPLPVFMKMPYRIEIDLPNTTSGTSIWAQVGRLPAITYDTYTLTQTETTSYNWILVPLDMTGITDSNLLRTSIQSNTTPSATVIDVSEWNGTGQVFTSNPFGSIGTRFGYPYRVEINYVTGNNAMWP